MLHAIAGWQIATAGFRDEAAVILNRTADARTGTTVGRWARLLERALAGDREGALAQGSGLENSEVNEFGARMIADALALLGQRDQALHWLRRATRAGFVNYPSLTDHAPFLRDLQDQPDFRALMEPVRQRWLALVEWERQAIPADPGAVR